MSDEISLAQAQAWLRDRLYEGGAKCPCCKQFAKVYQRSINSGMAKALIEQWKAYGQEIAHTQKLWSDYSKEAAQLSWWNLIDQPESRRSDGGRNGHWRVTDSGVLFVRDRLLVPKYRYVYDGRLVRSNKVNDENNRVDIRHCLREKFNYEELMSRGDE